MTEQIPVHELNDGTTLPAIGFGTYPLKGEEGVEAVARARWRPATGCSTPR